MQLGGASVAGPRPYNEDRYLLRDLSEHSDALGGLVAFIMVSDGMGGYQSGDVAARLAVETSEDYLDHLVGMTAQSHLEVDASLALKEIAVEAHLAVVRAAEQRGGVQMGATLVAAFVSGRKAWVGHVGDSRAYLLRDGSVSQITTDHSQVGRMIADGILTEAQAQAHPQRNVIERALGFADGSIDVAEVEIRSGDVLLLCSDGLSTVLSGEDMLEIAAGSSTADKAAESLAEAAIEAGTDDNTSAVVWSDDWSLFRMSSPVQRGRRTDARKQRRALAKHRSAQTTSWVILGLFGLAAAVIAGFALLGGQPAVSGTAGGGTSSTEASSESVPKEGESDSQDLADESDDGGSEGDDAEPPGNGDQAQITLTVDPADLEGAWLRAKEDPNDTSVEYVELLPGTPLTVEEQTATGYWVSVPEKRYFVVGSETPLFLRARPTRAWIFGGSVKVVESPPDPFQR